MLNYDLYFNLMALFYLSFNLFIWEKKQKPKSVLIYIFDYRVEFEKHDMAGDCLLQVQQPVMTSQAPALRDNVIFARHAWPPFSLLPC